MRPRIALLVVACALGCGPKIDNTQLIPTLPGDGDEHTAKPGLVDGGKSSADDPWANRTDLIEAPVGTAPSALRLPPLERFKLKNGLEVIVVADPGLPVVEMQLVIKAGRQDAPRDKMGIASLAAAMLTAGTKKQSAIEIAEKIDFVGGAIAGNASLEASLLRCSVLSKDTPTCLSLLADVIVNPAFRAEEMVMVRDKMRAHLLQRREDPGQLAAAHFKNLLWGEEHARGWPISMTTMAAISRKDLQAWHKRWYRPNNAVLAIAGDVDIKKLRRDLDRAFRGWRKAKLPPRTSYKAPAPTGLKVRLVDMPGRDHAEIRVGHFGLPHKHADFYATMIFNYVLGGGYSSRLIRAARAGGGQVASSSFDRNLDRGAFVARTFAPSKEAVASLRSLIQEIGKMAASGPNAAEVGAAITNITGRYVTGFESSAAVANAVLGAALHDLPDDYVHNFALGVARVSVDAAREAAATHLHPQALAVVIVGAAAAIEPQLKAVGLAYDKVSYLEPIARYERVEEPADLAGAAEEGRKILAKALAAKGGEKVVSAIKTLSLEGTAQGAVQDPQGNRQKFVAQVKRFYMAPRRMRRDMDIENGKVVSAIVLDGNSAWAYESQGGKSGVGELPPAFVQALNEQLWRDQEFVLLRFKEKGAVVTALADKKIDGLDHHVVRVSRADGSAATTLFIAKKTYLLSRMTYAAQGASAVESFSDYRDVDGVKVAHRRVTTDAMTTFDVTMTKVKINPELDAKLFEKPQS